MELRPGWIADYSLNTYAQLVDRTIAPNKLLKLKIVIGEMEGETQSFHASDWFWRKAFQPEVVVIYCEG